MHANATNLYSFHSGGEPEWNFYLWNETETGTKNISFQRPRRNTLYVNLRTPVDVRSQSVRPGAMSGHHKPATPPASTANNRCTASYKLEYTEGFTTGLSFYIYSKEEIGWRVWRKVITK